MELNTFGALLKFALELEEAAARFYEGAANAARDEALRNALAARAESAKKNTQRLERVRREQVNEMLLESIEGLRESDYRAGGDASPGAGDDDLTASAAALEAACERFYRDAAERLSIPEVVRSFRRLADAHARNRAELGRTQ
jgi:rubrerythrin